ncbi:MAG: hypothetical protein AAGL89_12245 [Pseudomonadota bacterium]
MTIVKPRDRLEGWQLRVAKIITERTELLPPKFGRNDCFVMASDVEAAMYGHSFWARYARSGYTTDVEAVRHVRTRFRKSSLRDVTDRIHRRIDGADIGLGDFAVAGLMHALPVIYLWDGNVFRTVPNSDRFPAIMRRQNFLYFWRM